MNQFDNINASTCTSLASMNIALLTNEVLQTKTESEINVSLFPEISIIQTEQFKAN